MSKPSSRKSRRMPEDQLRDLQRTFKVVEDQHDLRQPYRFNDDPSRQTVIVETFTTYGAYEDPI